MPPEKFNKTDSEQIILLLNEAHKLVVQVRPSTIVNNSIDITSITNHVDDNRPDPLRVPEIMIIIGVLLLWFSSILVFIRHSELLRIRHRDLPYRLSGKSPMNLNHITVVHRTSDMVIHSKPRHSSTSTHPVSAYNRASDEYPRTETISSLNPPSFRQVRPRSYTDSINSITNYSNQNEQLLNPYMISSDVRHSLLNLHRKSIDNLGGGRHSISYSTNEMSRRQESPEQHRAIDERCIQESPV